MGAIGGARAALARFCMPAPLAGFRARGAGDGEWLLGADGVVSDRLVVASDGAWPVLVAGAAVPAGAPLCRIPARWVLHPGSAPAVSEELGRALGAIQVVVHVCVVRCAAPRRVVEVSRTARGTGFGRRCRYDAHRDARARAGRGVAVGAVPGCHGRGSAARDQPQAAAARRRRC